ncbi:MAG TPA: TonB-dependent receptor, partial [Candidatus Latescibacteria bacterium]|nr:TonB-dependent receptor [Candidatus Latescibacterota bacterium]
MALKVIGLVVVWSLALVWGGAVAAQEAGTLVGVVLDSDGQPLPGAIISVNGPELTKNAGSLADTSGAFLIQPLPSGLYDVEISHLGYRNVVKSVRIGAGETRDLNFVLEVALIYLEQSVVTASRTQEKALDAPASVAIVEGEEIQDRSVLNVSEHVRDLPGVDYAKNGLVQSNVVVRGFNNIFSGALLTLTDNRLASVPSLRLNANNFIPVVNDDIERIEVVLGPGSALYGPNSANGVMHIITRSSLRSQGTSVQIGLGERSLRKSSLRHAGTITPHLGYKISAQYYTGTDWKYDDPTEAAERAATPTLKARDFDIKRQSAELRFDYEPSSDLQFIVSGGLNKADYIELTGLGAGQGKDWASNYAQARLIYGNLFAQVFRNWSDAGDTFLLRSGTPIVDRSSISVFQIQHRASLKDRLKLTYGLDALLTR